MNAGDVIAFGGSSHFSGIIKLAIHAEVSHIGILLQTQVKDEKTGERINYIIDSTSRQGVAISRMENRLEQYDGEVWWLPLQDKIRGKQFNQQPFSEFLMQQKGKKYDHSQAAGSAIDFFDDLPFGWRGPGYNDENFTRLFCSELVAASLKAAGILPENLNASEATPIDICRWNIFAPEYYLLKGRTKEISGYNSLEPLHSDLEANNSSKR